MRTTTADRRCRRPSSTRPSAHDQRLGHGQLQVRRDAGHGDQQHPSRRCPRRRRPAPTLIRLTNNSTSTTRACSSGSPTAKAPARAGPRSASRKSTRRGAEAGSVGGTLAAPGTQGVNTIRASRPAATSWRASSRSAPRPHHHENGQIDSQRTDACRPRHGRRVPGLVAQYTSASDSPTDHVGLAEEFVAGTAVMDCAAGVERLGFDACFVTDHPQAPGREVARRRRAPARSTDRRAPFAAAATMTPAIADAHHGARLQEPVAERQGRAQPRVVSGP